MPVENRKVFISWSKSPTDIVATEFAILLRHMFDNVRPFVSKDNVAFGSLSIGEIHRQLAGTSYGVLIVTRANQSEPWLNFEAGSLAKTIPDDSDARVVPLLIDHESLAQLTGPIANLQAVIADEGGVRRLLSEMADHLGVDAVVFESRWPHGWERIATVLTDARAELDKGPAQPERTAEDMLEEIVSLLRRPQRTGTDRTGPDDAERALANQVFKVLNGERVHFLSMDLRPRDGIPSIHLTFRPDDYPGTEQMRRVRQHLATIAPGRVVDFDVQIGEG